MLADCSGCDPRNPFPGHVATSPGSRNLHPPSAEIDYRGRDVSVESIMQVLTGKHPKDTPISRRMDSTRNSSVLLYLTGHGGDGFLKLHDQSELLSSDMAAAIKTMNAAGRYKELLLVLDTCQAATLYSELADVPGWAGIASSKLGQSSYALRSDPGIGAHLVDEFSHYVANYLDGLLINSALKRGPSLEAMLRYLKGQRMSSEIAVESSSLGRSLDDVKVMEFFGGEDGRGEGWVRSGKNEEKQLCEGRNPKRATTAAAADIDGQKENGDDRRIKLEGNRLSDSLYDLLLTAGLSAT